MGGPEGSSLGWEALSLKQSYVGEADEQDWRRGQTLAQWLGKHMSFPNGQVLSLWVRKGPALMQAGALSLGALSGTKRL